MKKKISLIIAVCLGIAALSGCGSSPATPSAAADTVSTVGSTDIGSQEAAQTGEGGGKLVLYSTESDDLINMIVPGFEAKFGVDVEIVTAGTGEILKRIQSEKESPMADVLLGASYLMANNNADLFEIYPSSEDDQLLDDFKFDKVGQYKMGCSVLLVNTDLIGDIEIKGYKDLLNPELKGRIAMADAAASSSSFDHLINMLVDFSPEGANESEEAWEYVQELLYNVDGKILNGSSAVHKGVVDGEYAVGLTYEDPAGSYLLSGATNVEVVYMEEGVVFFGSALNIVKGAKNIDNAKLFIDYVMSSEVQDKFGTEASLRSVRKEAQVGEHMKPFEEINVATVDIGWVSDNQNEITAKFTDLMTNVN